jgi:hypothetical protein
VTLFCHPVADDLVPGQVADQPGDHGSARDQVNYAE